MASAFDVRMSEALSGHQPCAYRAIQAGGTCGTLPPRRGEAGFPRRRFVGKAGDVIGDADAAPAVDPDSRAQPIGIAGMADPGAALALRIVGARGQRRSPAGGWRGRSCKCHRSRRRGRRCCRHTARRGEHRLDRLRRQDTHAVQRSAVEQHPADPGQAPRGNPQAALRREQRAIIARLPAIEVAGAVRRGRTPGNPGRLP